jgi:hypothetical protein
MMINMARKLGALSLALPLSTMAFAQPVNLYDEVGTPPGVMKCSTTLFSRAH